MTRRLLIILLWLACTGILSYFFLTKLLCKKYFYYSPDGQRVVTRLEYGPIFFPQFTYFTLGRHKGIIAPTSYIRPIYSGRDGGFVVLMHWTDSSCIFYFPHGRYDSINTGKEFHLQELSEYSNEWKKMADDTVSGNNKILTEYLF
jgi:hypothetical protein